MEQGFTYSKRPSGVGQLVVELTVDGGMAPRKVGNDAILERNGATLLSYEGLKAWDAKGISLKTKLEVNDSKIRLVVEDEYAEYPVTVDPFILKATLTASDGVAGDQFGYSVSLNSGTAVVGARFAGDTGAAYVFVNNGTTWAQQTKLTALGGASHDQFGRSVSISGDTVVVGSPIAQGLTGAAYVFTRSGTTWTQQAKLIGSDSIPGDQFGNSVAVNGNFIIVGAAQKAFASGAAYVFSRSGSDWRQQAELLPVANGPENQFGTSVSINGSTALVGAPGSLFEVEEGGVYVFTRTGISWGLQATLEPLDNNISFFGQSVSLSGNSALIGGSGNASSAYVFVRNGNSWSEQQKFSSPPRSVGFAQSVALSGNVALVGSDLSSNSGAAYVYLRKDSSWTAVTRLAALGSSNFGFAVALEGTTALVGAYESEAAYVFLPSSQ